MKRLFKSLNILLAIVMVFNLTVSVALGEETSASEVETPVVEESIPYPVAPEVVAKGAILMDADTGAILYEKDAYSQYYPASITKIMTCLLAIENLSLEDEITFTEEVFATLPWDAALLGVQKGETLTVKDCLYGLMIRSGNEVAVALAIAVSGSEEEFGKLMTERAKEMGANSTVFTNASGLYQDTHITTPYDMAVITKEALKNGTFAEVFGTAVYEMSATNMNEPYTIYHTHSMLVEGREQYYQYAKGGKTGYEDLAKRTLVTYAEKDGLSLISVVMFDENDAYFPDTEKLLDFGFTNFKKVRVIDGEDRFGSGSFVSIPDTDYLTIPNDVNIADLQYETIYNEDNSDGKIAQIKYYYDGHYMGESKLNFVEQEETDKAGVVTPVIKEEKEKENVYIDIGYILAAIAAIIIIILIIVYLVKTKEARKIKRDRKRLFKEASRKYKIKKRRRN